MVIWPVLQSIASKLSPTTSPARTPSLASSNKMAWFRLPTDVFRSQHFAHVPPWQQAETSEARKATNWVPWGRNQQDRLRLLRCVADSERKTEAPSPSTRPAPDSTDVHGA